jgi:dipeptidase E
MSYVGWSAGSNVACPSLKTTNDMPIVQPPDFSCLNLVPFQINPHYLDAHPDGHGGETREDRIMEFLTANPSVSVVGLREATAFMVEKATISLLGKRPLRFFQFGLEPREFAPGSDINFLLHKLDH